MRSFPILTRMVTKLPENHPDGAVALLEYTYNDRKVGEVYIISAKQAAIDETAQAGGETPESAPEGQDSDSGKEAGGTVNFAFKLPKQAPWIMLIGVLAAAGRRFSILFIKKKRGRTQNYGGAAEEEKAAFGGNRMYPGRI